jgi:hypothetical protein
LDFAGCIYTFARKWIGSGTSVPFRKIRKTEIEIPSVFTHFGVVSVCLVRVLSQGFDIIQESVWKVNLDGILIHP